MAHIIRDKEILYLSIYVILFEEEKKFIVGKTEPEKMKQVYKYHYYGGSRKTKSLFMSSREKEIVPPMHCLELLETTQEDAFLHCVAWAKYFLEHGLSSCCGEMIDLYAAEMRKDCKRIYEGIKDKTLDETCPTGMDLFPEFGKRKVRQQSQEKRLINFRVTPEESEQLLAAAEDASLSVSKYCRKMCLNGRVVNIDHNTFTNLTACVQEMVNRDNLLKNILAAIYSTEQYYQADLEIIQKAIQDNAEQQRVIAKEIQELLREIRR